MANRSSRMKWFADVILALQVSDAPSKSNVKVYTKFSGKSGNGKAAV